MSGYFPERFEGEKVLLMKRRHPVLLAADLTALGLVMAGLIIAPFYLKDLGKLYDIVSAGKARLIYLGLLALVAILVYARYFNWKYDWFIITDQRVVDTNR